MEAIGIGLKAGAEAAGVEIPGGEVAVLPDLIRGHPSPHGFDLTAACFGTVALDAARDRRGLRAGRRADRPAVLGPALQRLLARPRRAGPLALDAQPAELGGASVADVLLEPTVIYVRAVLELLRSELDVRGLAHITGGGVLNLLRLHADVGFQIDRPLPVPPVFGLVQALGEVPDAEMWEVFNMGCGFCVVVPAARPTPPWRCSSATTRAPRGSAP